MKTVKLLSALVLCLCAMSASAATGSGAPSDVSHVQYISSNIAAQSGAIQLASWVMPRAHRSQMYHRRMHDKRAHYHRHSMRR
jgi:hypothetical protein